MLLAISDQCNDHEIYRNRKTTQHAKQTTRSYGFQWRHFGATYGTCNDDYSGRGVDQLARVIDTIRANPTDRRMCLRFVCLFVCLVGCLYCLLLLLLLLFMLLLLSYTVVDNYH
jgi:hypothetical protein